MVRMRPCPSCSPHSCLTVSGGHIKPDVYYNILKYTEKYGATNAAAFARFEAANVLAVKELVEREKIDCDFVLTRGLDVYLDEAHARSTYTTYQELQRIGVADLGDIHYIEGPNAEAVSYFQGSAWLGQVTGLNTDTIQDLGS